MNTTGPFDAATNFPVPIRVTNPGTIDCFRDRLGWKASRCPERMVRLPSSRS